MVARKTTWPGARRRRGTALIELAFCLPFLALIIMLTFFFGWSMTNQQHVKAAVRHATWRRVLTGSVLYVDELDARFFGNTAPDPDYDGWGGPMSAQQGLVEACGEFGEGAQDLADQLALHTFPSSRTIRVSARFQTDIDAWRRFRGSIRDRHTRTSVEWRRRQARCEHALREQFLFEIDRTLDSVLPPGENLARRVRSLYTHGW